MKSLTMLFFLSMLIPAANSAAQDLNGKVLLNIGGRDVETGEFIRMYNKSREPGKKQDPEEYLNQFILFKLKVADAINEGKDTSAAFRNELAGYREQLARNYLTDNSARERFLDEACRRSLSEINAWHILISLKAGALPADTLEAYSKAMDVRRRISGGEPFETVAREASADPSVKMNGGNLGYFTAFQMVAPFEDAAYRLEKGSISYPVRTPFGYHIIRVADTRPARGRVHVAHIMKTVPAGAGESEAAGAQNSIEDMYARLNGGASFSDLARQYSDHRESAQRGGELAWFGTGEIITEFAEAAFSISDTGMYTRPVRTPYGWHIIKLLGRKGPGSPEEIRSAVEARINPDYLAEISRNSFIESLKKKYAFRIDAKSEGWFGSNTDSLVMNGLKKYERAKMPAGNIFTFADRGMTTGDFAVYIESGKSKIAVPDPGGFIKGTLESIAAEQLLAYENSRLEMIYPEFRYLMQEFHDGILLFEISDRKIWKRAASDTTGLRRFEESRKKQADYRQGDIEKMNDELSREYQDFLEKEWTVQLKSQYPVKINEAVKEEVMKILDNE